jgi:molybdopterin-guanine dinucleotide biosynthesis protein B
VAHARVYFEAGAHVRRAYTASHMNVIGFCGYSGAGKTTLVEKLVANMKRSGRRVSVIKHAHHDFDIDVEGKDSWRHRKAGAFEVLICSNLRLTKIREFDTPAQPGVHKLIAELGDCDWVFVEGFKHAPIPKIEVWRAHLLRKPQYPNDRHIVAVCTDFGAQLLDAPQLPVFDLNDASAVAGYLTSNAARFNYCGPPSEPEVSD